MPDMLVRLYDLDQYDDGMEKIKAQGIVIKSVMAPNLTEVREWIKTHFSLGWADEASNAILSILTANFSTDIVNTDV